MEIVKFGSMTLRIRLLLCSSRTPLRSTPFSPRQPVIDRRNFNYSAARSTKIWTETGRQTPDNTSDPEQLHDEEAEEISHKILFTEFLHALSEYSASVKVDEHAKQDERHKWQFVQPETQVKRQHDTVWRSMYRRLRTHNTDISGADTGTQTTLSTSVRDVPSALRKSGPITNPPISDLNLVFVDKTEFGPCPCILESECLPRTRLRASDLKNPSGDHKLDTAGGSLSTEGITFDMLLDGLCKAMHGHDDGSPALIGGRNDRLRLHQFSWMIYKGGLYTNDIFVYVEGCTLWK